MKSSFLFSSYHAGSVRYAKARREVNAFVTSLRYSKVIVYKHWSTTYDINKQDVEEANFVLSHIEQYDCKTRNECGRLMSLFTNSTEVLDAFKKDPHDITYEIHELDPALFGFLEINPKMVIVEEEPDLKYKVYLKGIVDPSFASWIDANQNKCRVGDITLYNIRNRCYLSNNYLFIRDSKVLALIKLIVGYKISKIEKLVYRGNIDKYIHANEE